MAASLKTTAFSPPAASSETWLLMRRFATVSTGWKTSSSATPAQPEPSTRASSVPLPEPPAADSATTSFSARLDMSKWWVNGA